MSDKYTEVELAGGGGLGLWGHVAPAEAIAQTRRYYEGELKEAMAALSALDRGEVQVFHQLGPWARRNRRQVHP